MNNRVLKIFVIFLSSFIYLSNLSATCNDKDLNDWAEKVKIEFKEVDYAENSEPEAEYDSETEFAYILVTTPYNENVTVKAKDTYSDDFYDVGYDEESKSNAIGSSIHFEKKNYIIRFYGKGTCDGELLREINYSVPSYNLYSDTEFCSQEKNKDEDICQRFKDTSNVTVEDFEDEVKKIQESDTSTFNKVIKTILKYWYYAVLPFAIIGVIYCYKVQLLKRGQKKR